MIEWRLTKSRLHGHTGEEYAEFIPAFEQLLFHPAGDGILFFCYEGYFLHGPKIAGIQGIREHDQLGGYMYKRAALELKIPVSSYRAKTPSRSALWSMFLSGLVTGFIVGVVLGIVTMSFRH